MERDDYFTPPEQRPLLAFRRIYELLDEFGITETDQLKHALEDWQRSEADARYMQTLLAQERAAKVRAESKLRQIEEPLSSMYADHMKYPQLRLPDMQSWRLSRMMDAITDKKGKK